MDFWQLSQAVDRILKQSEIAFKSFVQDTQLNCLNGCGACCLNPKVEACPLEFFPFVANLLHENLAMELWEKLKILPAGQPCALYQAQSGDGKMGNCTIYSHRPMICRSFGAMIQVDKYQRSRLSVCKLIRQELPKLTAQVEQMIYTKTLKGPSPTFYQEQIINLAPGWMSKFVPINQALVSALEYGLSISSYSKDSDSPIQFHGEIG